MQQHQEAPSQQKEPTQEHILEKVHILNKKCNKRRNQQAMVTNLRRKRVQTHQDDEVRYIFTPIKQSYNNNLNNILLWINFKKEKRTWANRACLLGLFEVKWKTPRHNILVEFLNNWKLDSEHRKIKIMMGEKQKIIDRHFLAEVF